MPAGQITCPTMTAATAENSVMLRAVRGFCPWATAKLVITPAPRHATASWVVRAGRCSTGSGSIAGSLLGATTQDLASLPAVDLRYAPQCQLRTRVEAGLARPLLAHCCSASSCSRAVRDSGTS